MAAVLFGSGVSAAAQQPRRVELVEPGSGRIFGTIHISSQAVTLESGDGQSVIYTPTSLVHVNHKEKTYYEQTYELLAAMAAQAVKDLPAAKDAPPGVEYKLTTETETIAGCRAVKLVRTGRGASDSAWVCKDWQPPAMRKAGDRLAGIFPADYWRRIGGNPGVMETVLIYGIPLRAERSGKLVYDARVTAGTIPAGTFEIPAGYKKVPAPK